MSCERHRNAIVDHACGAEIPADAAAHVKNCEACNRLFLEERRQIQDLDEQLQLALAIEPSARFVSTAMARVERSALGRRSAFWWSVVATAAATVLVVITLGALRLGERRADDRRAAASSAPASPASVADRALPAAPAASVEDSAPVPVTTRTSERTRRVARSEPMRQPSVVVPTEQGRALERYLALIRRGALEPPALAANAPPESPEPVDLVVAPLSVDAVVLPDVEREAVVAGERRGLR